MEEVGLSGGTWVFNIDLVLAPSKHLLSPLNNTMPSYSFDITKCPPITLSTISSRIISHVHRMFLHEVLLCRYLVVNVTLMLSVALDL